MNKLELIKAITNFHPDANAGKKRNWSWYTGGMADTGEWYFRKLLDASVEELEKCLEELKVEFAPKPEPVYSEQDLIDQKTLVKTPNGITTAYELKQMKKLVHEYQKQLLWGKQA